MPHNMIFYFHLPLFHVSNSVLFLHSILALSYYKDEVKTFHTEFEARNSDNKYFVK